MGTAQREVDHPSLALSYFDARGSISAGLDNLKTGMSDALIDKLPVSHLHEHYKEPFEGAPEVYDDSAWRKIEELIRQDKLVKPGALPTKTYIAYLSQNLLKLTGLFKKYSQEPEVTALLTKII